MSIFKKYQDQRKRSTLKILAELAKRIRSGELVIDGCGFWDTRTSNKVIFQFRVISRNSDKEIKDFERL